MLIRQRRGLILIVFLLFTFNSNAWAAGIVIHGKLVGGQSPISGASVTLFQAGTAGYGQGATQLAGPIKSNAGGAFTFKLPTGCPLANALVYVTAQGGKPAKFRKAASNPAIFMIAMLGACNSIAGSIKVDEVTTVGAAYALAQFFGTSPPYPIGAPASNAIGLANAVTTVRNLADVKTGKTPAKPPVTATLPLAKVNTLADILASCIGSKPSGSSCTTLLNAATPNASPAPVDTLGAILDIAHDPWNNASALFSLVGNKPPFKPVLASAPQHWALIAAFAGGGLSGPNPALTHSNGCASAADSRGLAIDAAGNIWLGEVGGTDDFGIVKLSPIGAPLSPSTGFKGGLGHPPAGLAIDAANNLWFTQDAGGAEEDLVREIPIANPACLPVGPACTFFFGLPAIDKPLDVAIDSGGSAWVVNFGAAANMDAGSLTELPATSNFSGGGLNQPLDVAIDGSDNVWVANSGCSAPGCVAQGAANIGEFQSNGSAISPGTGFINADITAPINLAIGLDGQVWVADSGSISKPSSIVELNSSGTEIGSFTGGGATSEAVNIAVDGAGRVWATSNSGGCTGAASGNVIELDSDGSALASCSAFADPAINSPECGLAIDQSGNVWVADDGTCSVVEIIGAATPVKTPLQGLPAIP